jgi:hypothetical protein
MPWLAEGLGLSAVMVATAGVLIRVLLAVGVGRLPPATLALMLAIGAGLVALALHISNPDLGLVVFVVGALLVVDVVGFSLGMLVAAVLPSRHKR